MSTVVWGVFEAAEEAANAVEQLVDASFPPEEISVLLQRGETLKPMPTKLKTAVPQGLALGMALGAVGGLALSALPGGVFAAGPILGALQAMGIGAGAGGLGGALGGLAWWKDEADLPSAALEEGRVLVALPVPPGRVEETVAILECSGAIRVGS
jgi:hypothetical protein